jgi:hypothetical protein
MRAGLDLLPTWVLEPRRLRTVGCRRHAPAVAAGEQVARMYQEPGPAWLERQAEVAEDLVAASAQSADGSPAVAACLLPDDLAPGDRNLRPGPRTRPELGGCVVGATGFEPVTSSVSAVSGEPLCYPPLSQVAVTVDGEVKWSPGVS